MGLREEFQRLLEEKEELINVADLTEDFDIWGDIGDPEGWGEWAG